jgi:hypothetical protein
VARLRVATVGLVTIGCLIVASSASALTLGTTTIPTGSSVVPCTNTDFFVQTTTDPSYSYAVPASGGEITSWSTNTSASAAGAPLTLLILQPVGAGYTVLTTDAETLPTPLPAGGVTTFTLAQPLTVASGDVLGLYSPGTLMCVFTGGTIPIADAVGGNTETSIAPGTNYPTLSFNVPGVLLNVSANLIQSEDVAVTGAAAPASITAGGAAEYAFSVANSGPETGAITFTDTVPGSLKILSAVAGSGTCSTAGQAVTCTITGLAVGATAPVSIIVSAPAAGTYPDTAAVAARLDPTPADNTATATLTVTAPAVAPAPSCKTINLTRAPLAVAKAVIPALNCRVGKTTKKASKKIHKGYVISTSPGAGKTLTAGTKVNIVVSSGPPKKKKAKKRKK